MPPEKEFFTLTHHYLKKGDPAPEFSLSNQKNKSIAPLSMEARRVLLSFHPLAWTSICEIQMRSLEAKHSAFKELDTIAYGLSVDSSRCKKAWAEAIGINKTDILADFWPHGEVAQKYGLFLDDMGISNRANVLIGPERTIEWVKVYDIVQIPDIEEIIDFIKSQN